MATHTTTHGQTIALFDAFKAGGQLYRAANIRTGGRLRILAAEIDEDGNDLGEYCQFTARALDILKAHVVTIAPEPTEHIAQTFDPMPMESTAPLCESCAVDGIVTPATTRGTHAAYSGYDLCDECAAEYDARA